MTVKQKMQQIIAYLLSLIGCIIAKIKNFFVPKKTIQFDNGPKVTLCHKIAEGGFSYIYFAKDKLDRTYACKRIICNDDDVIQNCQKEADVHKSVAVNCENLLQMYGIKFVKKQKAGIGTQTKCYMLFPLITGGSLRDEISKRKLLDDNVEKARPIKEREILSIFKGVLNGIKALHEAGYAHCDVKLENVLLDRKKHMTSSPDEEIGSNNFSLGTPILMDFGSARTPLVVQLKDRRTVLTLTEEALVNSTISYRAPELFDGGCRHGALEPDIDGKIDVWSAGCVLYGMMYGSSPFEIEFRNGDGGLSSDVRIVECTHLRVLGSKIPFPAAGSRRAAIFQYTPEIKQLVEWILTVDRMERPSIDAVYEKVENLLMSRHGGEMRSFR